MRVSSRSMIGASKPFSTMFSPDWKEGRNLLSRDEPVDVHLPEDDPEALRLICAVIHHRNEAVPRNLSPIEVFRVAVAADKYDCVGVLKFASETWLWLREMNAQDMAFLTTAAYILGNAEAFKELTKALVLSYDGPYIALCCEQMESAMTWRVFCLLEGQRSLARLKLADILQSGIHAAGCCHRCGWDSKYAYAYLRLLQDNGFRPTELINISKSIKSVELLHDPVPEERSTECNFGYKHKPPEYRKDRRWQVEFLESHTGLCLYCVRGGRSDPCYCSIDHSS
ncbi:hypothetical protein PSPO01_16576 [Paraphaeosphaeria sporulosa]